MDLDVLVMVVLVIGLLGQTALKHVAEARPHVPDNVTIQRHLMEDKAALVEQLNRIHAELQAAQPQTL
jgi:hypothetical protein